MHFKLLSAISFNLDQSKILPSGNGLTFSEFCPEIKSTGTNGRLSLKKVGHFRKYGAQYDANSLSAFRQVEKT